jgi:hypothetical protein
MLDFMINRAEVAARLNLEELRVGRHYIRGMDRERVGAQLVLGIYCLRVFPRFHDGLEVWIVIAKGDESGEKVSPSWSKVAVLAQGEMVVDEIDASSFLSHVSAADLSGPRTGITLDGVRYELEFETLGVAGVLKFSNPQSKSLKGIASSVLDIAARVVSNGASAKLGGTLENWCEYVQEG